MISDDRASGVCDDHTILSLVVYLENVFYDDRYSHDRIGRYLNDCIGERYIHGNGDRKLYSIYECYRTFYSSFREEELMTSDYMSKLLRGTKGTFYYICQMGLFLDVKLDDLLGYESESDEGRIFRIVAERLDQPVEIVESIGTAILKEYKNHGDNMVKEIRYRKKLEDDDIKLLKDVKAICTGIYGSGDKRPGKVTVKAVSRALGIDPHRMNKMRLCMEEIERYHETQEHYWAREIIWAVERIQESNETLTFTRINRCINIRRDKLLNSMQELKIQDEAVYMMVHDVL